MIYFGYVLLLFTRALNWVRKWQIAIVGCKQNKMNNWITLSKLVANTCKLTTKPIVKLWNTKWFYLKIIYFSLMCINFQIFHCKSTLQVPTFAMWTSIFFQVGVKYVLIKKKKIFLMMFSKKWWWVNAWYHTNILNQN
jgi:hypothetical protein